MIDDTRSFQRLAATAAILAAPLAIGNLALGLAAIGFAPTPGMLTDAAATLPIEGIDAGLLRWSLICDIFGYYLLLGPLALALGRRLGQERPSFVRLATCCGLGYVLVGAIGAAVLAASAPPLIDAHAQAAGAERAMIELLYDGFVNVVNGLWNMLGMILGGVWWLTIGATVRAKRPALSVLSIVLGIAAWIDAAGIILNIALFSAIGLVGILLLIPVWSFSFGIDLLRQPVGTSPVAAPGEIVARGMLR